MKPGATPAGTRGPYRGLAARRGTYGGSFMYHMEERLVAVGFVVGLGYRIPTCRRSRNSSASRRTRRSAGFFEGGKRVSPTARARSRAGGLQSLPKLAFPGGALIGDEAGFLNASRIKGSHCAIKSGMLAAEAAHEALHAGRAATSSRVSPGVPLELAPRRAARARNFKPWMAKGLYVGTLMVGIDQVLFRGKAPWTLHHHAADHETLKTQDAAEPIAYPKPDGVLTFDRLSSVFISNTNHSEDQPVHLTLKDPRSRSR